jgi:hypothetical protein
MHFTRILAQSISLEHSYEYFTELYIYLGSLGPLTLSIVRSCKQLEITAFRKLHLFPSSGEGGRHSVGVP